MSMTATSPRKLLSITSIIVALVFGPLCLLWYAARSISNEDEMYPFLGVALLHLVAAVTFLVTAKSRWRWTILLLTLPCAFLFAERAFELSRW